MAREINLVPDIKDEMIKAIKLRNLIFFVCIVVAAGSLGAIAISGIAAGAQSGAINSKTATIKTMSEKVGSFSDLSDYLTIQKQVNGIDEIADNKQVFSRTFNILSALVQPVQPDKIEISELSVNLTGQMPKFVMEAQADATKTPFIDYNVLDSFKKSMQYLKYDYGNYVDKQGTNIPSYCMIETAADGSVLKDDANGYYAFWTINAEGCDPSAEIDASGNPKSTAGDYQLETYEDQQVVKIWRTPQFESWYHESPSNNQPNITLNGVITGVEHFESKCNIYSGNFSSSNSAPTWTTTNDNCRLIPNNNDGTPDITITESSNGRDSSDNLVLRFSATISITPEAYTFTNRHMLFLPVSDRYNVTDSYVQIQSIFGKRAADCEKDDMDCKNNGENK